MAKAVDLTPIPTGERITIKPSTAKSERKEAPVIGGGGRKTKQLPEEEKEVASPEKPSPITAREFIEPIARSAQVPTKKILSVKEAKERLRQQESEFIEPLAQETLLEQQQQESFIEPLDQDYMLEKKREKEEDKRKKSLGESVWFGIKSILNPFDITPEELKEQREHGNVIAEMAASIFTDVGTTLSVAALTPVIGPLLGTVGTLGYIAYKAFGQAGLTAKAHDRDVEATDVGLNLLLELNPLMKYGGGKAMRMVSKGATQAILQGAQVYKEGGKLEHLAIGAALGAFVGVGTHNIAAINLKKSLYIDMSANLGAASKRGLSLREAKGLQDIVDDNLAVKIHRKIEEKAQAVVMPQEIKTLGKKRYFAKRTGRSIKNLQKRADAYGIRIVEDSGRKKIAIANHTIYLPGKLEGKEASKAIDEVLQEHFDRFMKRIVGRPNANLEKTEELFKVKNKFKDIYAVKGEEAIAVSWGNYMRGTFLAQEIQESVEKGLVKTLSKDVLKTKGWGVNDRSAAMEIDRMTDGLTDMTPLIDILTKSENNVYTKYYYWTKRSKSVFKDLNKSGIKINQVRKYVEGIEKPINDAQRKAVEGWNFLMEDVFKDLKDLGLEISQLEGIGYFTHTMKDPVELAHALRKALSTKEGGKDFLEAVEVVTKYSKRKLPDKDAYMKAADEIALAHPGEVAEAIGGQYGLFRAGRLLDIELEENAEKVFGRYLHNMYSTVYYRDAMDLAHNQKMIIDVLGGVAAGGKKMAPEWVQANTMLENLIKTTTGEKIGEFRLSTDLLIRKIKNSGYKILEGEKLSMLKKIEGNLKVHGTDLLGFAFNSAYPNLLGFNVTAPIRNMTQTIFLTAPEIARTHYGYQCVAYGWLKAGQHVVKNKGKIVPFLSEKGLKAKRQFNRYLVMDPNNLANQSKMLGKPLKFVERLLDLGMSLYEGSDSANRLITHFAATKLARDAVKGNKKALNYIYNRMDVSNRRRAIEFLRKGSEEELGDLLSRQLNAKTQFLYSKHDSTLLGKTMGPAFTMFSKWPIATANDMIKLAKRNGGSLDILHRYLLPSAMLGYATAYFKDKGYYSDPIFKTVFGEKTRTINNWSPFSALTGLSIPPLIKSGADTLSGMKNLVVKGFPGDWGDIEDRLKDAVLPLKPYVPLVEPARKMSKYYDNLLD